MGWEIHITRKQHWAEPDGPQITFQEWQQYLATDAEIVKDLVNGEHDFLMLLADGTACPLWYNFDLGELHAKHPSDEAIEKAKQIAVALRARVLDDDDRPC